MKNKTRKEFIHICHEIKAILTKIDRIRKVMENPFKLIWNYFKIMKDLRLLLNRGLKIVREEYTLQDEVELEYTLKEGGEAVEQYNSALRNIKRKGRGNGEN